MYVGRSQNRREVPDYPVRPSLSHSVGRYVTAQILPIVRYREDVSGVFATPISLTMGGASSYGKGYRAIGSAGCYWASDDRFCNSGNDFSVEVIFTVVGDSALYDRVFEWGNGGGVSGWTGGWDLELSTSGTRLSYVGWAVTTPAGFDITPVFETGRSYHCLVTKSGSSMVAYLDGQQYATASITHSAQTRTNCAFMNFDAAGSNTPDGLLVHLMRFYNGTVLTSSDAAMLYADPFGMYDQPQNLRWWPAAAPSGFLPAWASQRSRIVGAGLH